MIVKELSFTANLHERVTIEDDINNLTATISQHERDCAKITADLANLVPVATYMKQLAERVRNEVSEHVGTPIAPRHDHTPFDGYRTLIEGTLNWDQWTIAFQNELNRRMQHTRGYLVRYEQRLSEQRMRLARAKPEREIVIRSSDFRNELQTNVKAKNARLHKSAHSMALEAVFDDIVLTPILNTPLPSWIKVLDGKPACVRIPPVKVIIDPISRCIRAKCVGSTRAADNGYIIGYSSYYVAHPHVIARDGSLCFGDWGGPIMEAMDAHDYTLTFDVIKQFLRSANDGDPAGKTWRKYIHANAAFNWGHRTPPVVRGPDGETLYQYFLLDGKGGVTTLTHSDPANWPDITIHSLAPPPQIVITELPEDQSMTEACEDPVASDYDDDGYDEDGYNRDGYDRDGFDEEGFDEEGYDREGFDRDGYDRDGEDHNGYDQNGIDQNGWSRDRINALTGTRYDEQGYTFWGFDSEGFDRDGRDVDGYDRDGFNRAGFNRNHLTRDGRSQFEQLAFETPEAAA